MPSRLRDFLPQASSLLIGVLLAVLAVLILVWVAFGIVSSSGDQGGQVTDQEMVAQSQDGDNGADTPAPEVENRNIDSYAAYEAKDPFRQIVEPADVDTDDDTDSSSTGDGTGDGDTGSGSGSDGSDSGSNSESDSDDFDSGSSGESDTGNPDGGGGDTTGNGTGAGGPSPSGGGGSGGSQGSQGVDRDRDGVSNRREQQLGLSPTNPDTDSDGIRDGADDSNGDGRPDRDIRARGGAGERTGGPGGNDGLFDSGGSLLPSGK